MEIMNNERKIRIFDDSRKNWFWELKLLCIGIVGVDNAACSGVVLLILVVFLKPAWIETCLEIRLSFGIQFQMKTSPNSEQTIGLAFRDNVLDL